MEDKGPSLLPRSPPLPSVQPFSIAKRRIEIHVSKLLFPLLYCNSLLDRQPPPSLLKLNVHFFLRMLNLNICLSYHFLPSFLKLESISHSKPDLESNVFSIVVFVKYSGQSCGLDVR